MIPLWMIRAKTSWAVRRDPADLAQYHFGASPYDGLDLVCKDCAVCLELWPEKWRITIDEAMHFVSDHHRRKHMKKKRKRRIHLPNPDLDGCADGCAEIFGDLIGAILDAIFTG